MLLIFGLIGWYSVLAVMMPFKPFRKVAAGSVSGLISGIQLPCAFVASAIAAHLNLSTLLPLGVLMAVTGVIGVT